MIRTGFVFFLICVVPIIVPARSFGGDGEAHPVLKTYEGPLRKWEAMRFGMFIHSGPGLLAGDHEIF